MEEFDDAAKIKRTNFIVVKQGNEGNEKVKELVKAIQSDEVKNFINEKYKGSVIISFLSEGDIK